MRVRRWVFLLTLCGSLVAAAETVKPAPVESGYEPIVMLTEHNPWLMVVGSDSPSFVLYRNGVVIFAKDRAYRTAKLTSEQSEALIRQLDLTALDSLDASYSLSDASDLPTNVLLFHLGNHAKTISVYGSIRSSAPIPQLPQTLYAAFTTLLTYENPQSGDWKPDFIEVMIWPFEYAKGKPANWPSTWPGLSSSTTVKRNRTISLFVPESQEDQLSTFLRGLKPTQAVLIDGRKWAISTRWPFPHEKQPRPNE